MNKQGKIGRGHPPVNRQFKPGQSGNPKGQSRNLHKAENGAEIPDARVEANMTQQMGLFEIKLRTLVHRALRDNDFAAVKEVLSICEKYKVIKPPAAAAAYETVMNCRGRLRSNLRP